MQLAALGFARRGVCPTTGEGVLGSDFGELEVMVRREVQDGDGSVLCELRCIGVRGESLQGGICGRVEAAASLVA